MLRRMRKVGLALLLLGLLVSCDAVSFNYKQTIHWPIDSKDQTTQSDFIYKCVDGDTFWINQEKIRLLAIDTPESTTKVEPYGKQASQLTCAALQAAKSITLEYDPGNEKDKYDRSLYWVWLDGVFLQETLVRQGLAEIKYVDKKTVNPQYLELLQAAQAQAKAEKLKIWH